MIHPHLLVLGEPACKEMGVEGTGCGEEGMEGRILDQGQEGHSIKPQCIVNIFFPLPRFNPPSRVHSDA